MYAKKINASRKTKVLSLDTDVPTDVKNHHCHDQLIKKFGYLGIFYTCAQCNATIPSDDQGLPQKPIGVCSVCRSYVYVGVNKSGVEYPICSRYFLHR